MIDRRKLERVIDKMIVQADKASVVGKQFRFFLECLMELNSYKLAEELGLITRNQSADLINPKRGQVNG